MTDVERLRELIAPMAAYLRASSPAMSERTALAEDRPWAVRTGGGFARNYLHVNVATLHRQLVLPVPLWTGPAAYLVDLAAANLTDPAVRLPGWLKVWPPLYGGLRIYRDDVTRELQVMLPDERTRS